VPQNHHQSRAEPSRSELDAADLRRSDDVTGNADDKQIAQTLVEDDLCWHSRVGTSENDREWLLTCRQLVAARLARERVAAPNVRHEATVAFSQAFECFSRWNHRRFVFVRLLVGREAARIQRTRDTVVYHRRPTESKGF
jgi:hypothetical protein